MTEQTKNGTWAAPLEVTEGAVRAARNAIEAEGRTCEGTYIRVGVRAGGCSGHSYALAFDTEARDGDAVVFKGDVRFLVDEQSRRVLSGTLLDYTSGLNGQGFVFKNPNATSTCGCGESFSV
jgi:iron-sulfur cluster assembly accessory protein